jgi:hypothetical protein
MSPATIAIIAQFAIQYGIPAALKLVSLFEKKDATVEDVKAAFSLAHKSYEEYVAGAMLPK